MTLKFYTMFWNCPVKKENVDSHFDFTNNFTAEQPCNQVI